MNIGENIKPLEVGQREFDVNELFQAIRGLNKVWSWGAHAWRTLESKGLRFAVSGHHHKGHVYIVLAWDDTFTIYYTTRQGKILDKQEMIYIDMLIDTIDKKVEYIAEYGNK